MGWSNPNQTDQPVRARLGRDPAAWPQPDFPDWIRTVPLPHATHNRTSLIGATSIGIIMLLVIALLAAMPIFTQGWGGMTTANWILYGLMLLLPAIFFMAYWLDLIRERRLKTRKLRLTSWAPMLEALSDANLPLRRCGSRAATASWERLSTAFDSRGLPLPRTIADLRVATELHQLELTDELVEPEKVVPGSRSDRRSQRNSLIMGTVLIAFGIIVDADLCLVFGILMVVIPLFSLQVVRRLAPDFLLGFSTVIAGPGFVHINDELIYRSGAATCLLRSIGSKRWTDSAVEAWFYSADGVRMLSFPSVHDPQFITLWQRWNHPQPRPELAGTA